MLAISILKETAADWIEPYFRDWNDNLKKDMKKATIMLFLDFGAYKQAMTSMFSDVSEARRAKQEVMSLRQGGTITEYTSKF